MRYKLAMILSAGGLMLGREPAPKAPVSSTEHFEIPANGVVRLEHSVGELRVDGWDRPEVELTTIKPEGSAEEPRVTAERRENELIITTKHRRGFPIGPGITVLEYTLKVPRTARLTVQHDVGDVHLDGLTGEIRVRDGKGEITIVLPENGQYAIEAKSTLGAVTSDFPGREQRKFWLFHHRFMQSGAGSAQKLNLHVGYGDIIILKARTPEMRATAP